MPHDLWEERFIGARRPAWHQLGKVFHDPITLGDAWQALPPYTVIDRPLVYPTPYGYKESGYRAVGSSRDGVTLDAVYTTVTGDYELLAPQQFVDMLIPIAGDYPVETMGALAGGSILFATFQTGESEVNGDEHAEYILMTCRADGRANEVAYVQVRVVCANSLNLALHQAHAARDVCVLHHTKGITARTVEWAEEAFATVRAKHAAITQVLEFLSEQEVDNGTVAKALEVAFPDPTRPKAHVNPATYEERMARWEVEMAKQSVLRAEALGLFQGGATGAATWAFQGTAYGLINSVVELVDHKMPGTNAATAAAATLYGYRAEVKARTAAYLLRQFSQN